MQVNILSHEKHKVVHDTLIISVRYQNDFSTVLLFKLLRKNDSMLPEKWPSHVTIANDHLTVLSLFIDVTVPTGSKSDSGSRNYIEYKNATWQ